MTETKKPDIVERLRAWRKSMPERWYGNPDIDRAAAEIERLRTEAALRAQADAQPVAWRVTGHWKDGGEAGPFFYTEERLADMHLEHLASGVSVPLCIRPAPEAAQAAQAGLSDDDILVIADKHHTNCNAGLIAYTRAILARASAATVAEPSEDAGRTGDAYSFKAPADLLRAKRNGTVFYLHDGDRAPVKVESIRPREHGVYVGGKGILPYWITLDGYGERPDIWLSAAQQQAEPSYADNTPQLHVGNSSFESWYADYKPAISASEKQISRDAYAAGMRDPLVIAKPVAQHPETKEGV